MKANKLIRIGAVIIHVFMLLTTNGTVSVSANSAQSSWTGVSSTGAFITDEDSPIVVENEVLTFDIQEFPKNHYDNTVDYLAYTGKVTAEYTLYNPADYTVVATLVFPFGGIPDYGHLYNRDTGERELRLDTDKYDITVDGVTIEKQLRHTLFDFHDQFELDEDIALLHDGYVEDDFYTPDMTVTKYTYAVSGVDEKYNAATAAFVLSSDTRKTKLLVENQSGGSLSDEEVQVHVWANNGETYTVYVIGQLLEEMPKWTFYENGACENKIDGNMSLINTETLSFKEFALIDYDETSGILDYDWYNAMVVDLKRSECGLGLVNRSKGNIDIIDNLMRWYEYEITIEPGGKIVNTVTAPLYPSINSLYNPSIYGYTYLLSPAKTWAEFGSIEIVINTPYYVTESSITGFNKNNHGYTLLLDELPEEELEFTICSIENPSIPKVKNYFSNGNIISFLVLSGITLLIVSGAVIFLIMCKKRKKKR